MRIHVLPVLIWLIAIAIMVALFSRRTQRFEVLGVAQGREYKVSATCTGRLKNLPVQLFEKVSKGQTVVVIDLVLDNDYLQAELDAISAEIEHLTARLAPTREALLAEQAERETDIITTYRRFSVDVENARLNVLELKALIETDRMVSRDLGIEVQASLDLVENQAVAPYDLYKSEAAYNTLAKKIEENQLLLVQAEADLAAARKRYDEFKQHQPYHASVDSALEVIRKAINVEEQDMELLLARRTPLNLIAPSDGLVSQIKRGQGDTVLRGESILTITEAKPTDIIFYASNMQLRRIKEGMAVRIIKSGEPAQVATSRITHLGPNVEPIPERLWQDPGAPQWGWPMLVEIPPNLKLVPGELVGVKGL